MPSNGNPYPVGHPLHETWEGAGQELKAALMADVIQSKIDRHTLATQAEDPYAATTWGLPSEQDFVCPSGQRCLVRRVEVMDLLGTSMLNKLDFMTSIVTSEHIPNADGKPAIKTTEADLVKSFAENQNSMSEFKEVINDVVIRVVVKPQLFPVPPKGEERVNGRVYVDSVSLTDKTEIFNWAIHGQNVDDLKRFREESIEPVGTVESGEIVQHNTVQTTPPL